MMHKEKEQFALRNVLLNFYSPLKACEPYLRFVFPTGLTKFSPMGIFSGLNNLNNISMDESYAAICGISEDEILTQMDSDLDMLAARIGMSRIEVLKQLKRKLRWLSFYLAVSQPFQSFQSAECLCRQQV